MRITKPLITFLFVGIMGLPRLAFPAEEIVDNEAAGFNRLDASYMGLLSGPSIVNPSINVPGKASTPINLKSYVKLGYRIDQTVSVGAVFGIPVTPYGVTTVDPGLAVSKYRLLSSQEVQLDADIRLMYSPQLAKFAALQSFQTTTYTPKWAPLLIYHLSFVHYDLNSNVQVLHSMPVVSYRVWKYVYPAIFGRGYFTSLNGNWSSDLVAGPGAIIRVKSDFLLGPALAINLKNPQLESVSFVLYAQAQVF